jgi:cystathionine beta-lyase/cystathionine gamma-synthase
MAAIHAGISIPAKAIRIVNGLEAAFAALEAGKVAVAFASGCAAITAVLRTLKPGDDVIISDDVFQGTVRILREVLPSGRSRTVP